MQPIIGKDADGKLEARRPSAGEALLRHIDVESQRASGGSPGMQWCLCVAQKWGHCRRPSQACSHGALFAYPFCTVFPDPSPTNILQLLSAGVFLHVTGECSVAVVCKAGRPCHVFFGTLCCLPHAVGGQNPTNPPAKLKPAPACPFLPWQATLSQPSPCCRRR